MDGDDDDGYEEDNDGYDGVWWLGLTVDLPQSRISWEESLREGIIWIRLASEHVCGSLSSLLIEAGRPTLNVGGTITWSELWNVHE